jgi:hypothetical protein
VLDVAVNALADPFARQFREAFKCCVLGTTLFVLLRLRDKRASRQHNCQ